MTVTRWLAIIVWFGICQGCDEKQMSNGALTQSCYPGGSPTGTERRVGHPTKPSECRFGVLMMCNSCVYEPGGALSHSASEICGVCISGSF